VVLPTRNRRTLLARALGTVLAQEGVEVEAVVVDDASEDDTSSWLATLDERVVPVRNEARLGVAAARNAGLERASAPWTAFVDDDDVWSPRKLGAQLAAALESGAEWATAGAVVLDRELEVRAAQHVMPPERFLPLLLGHNVVPGGASGVVARTELVRRVGGFDPDLRIMADWDLWIRLALAAVPAGVDRPLVGYVLHGENMTSAPEGFRRELARVREKHAAALAEHGVEPDDTAWSEWLSEVQGRSGHRLAPAREQLRIAVRARRPRALARALAMAAGPGWARRRDRWRLERMSSEWLAEAEAWLAPLRAARAQTTSTVAV
jgi:glycosyltransferase involved in cell wall biosynthesis